MRQFTAIYSTGLLRGVQYSFEAHDVKDAIKYASVKFGSYPNIAIISNEDNEQDSNYGRLVFLNGSVINGTYDVVFNDDNDSNNVGINGSYSECMAWIEHHRQDKSSYFVDYNGGSVGIYCQELDDYVHMEDINF